jgi:hypothetical protein
VYSLNNNYMASGAIYSDVLEEQTEDYTIGGEFAVSLIPITSHDTWEQNLGRNILCFTVDLFWYAIIITILFGGVKLYSMYKEWKNKR